MGHVCRAGLPAAMISMVEWEPGGREEKVDPNRNSVPMYVSINILIQFFITS